MNGSLIFVVVVTTQSMKVCTVQLCATLAVLAFFSLLTKGGCNFLIAQAVLGVSLYSFRGHFRVLVDCLAELSRY